MVPVFWTILTSLQFQFFFIALFSTIKHFTRGEWGEWGDWGDWGDWSDWSEWGEWGEWGEFRNFMNTGS